MSERVYHWRRHDDVVVNLVDTYAEDGSISGHGAYACNATACGHIVPHDETTDMVEKSNCRECCHIGYLLAGDGSNA